MTQKDIEQMHFDSTIPVCGLYSARASAKLFDKSIIALLGYNNICMVINKNSNLMEALKEYKEKLKFLVDIESKKQEHIR